MKVWGTTEAQLGHLTRASPLGDARLALPWGECGTVLPRTPGGTGSAGKHAPEKPSGLRKATSFRSVTCRMGSEWPSLWLAVRVTKGDVRATGLPVVVQP